MNEKLLMLAKHLETTDEMFDGLIAPRCIMGHAFFLMTGRWAAFCQGEIVKNRKQLKEWLEIDQDTFVYLFGCGWYQFGHGKQAAIEALTKLANGGNVNSYKPIKYLRPSHAD